MLPLSVSTRWCFRGTGRQQSLSVNRCTDREFYITWPLSRNHEDVPLNEAWATNLVSSQAAHTCEGPLPWKRHDWLPYHLWIWAIFPVSACPHRDQQTRFISGSLSTPEVLCCLSAHGLGCPLTHTNIGNGEGLTEGGFQEATPAHLQLQAAWKKIILELSDEIPVISTFVKTFIVFINPPAWGMVFEPLSITVAATIYLWSEFYLWVQKSHQ